MVNLRSAVPISSVQYPGRRLGVAAAELLLSLMAGRRAAPVAPLAPVRVVPRRSSETVANAHPVIQRALAWMRDRLSGNTGVRGLAAALDLGERSVHLLFAEQLGRGPAAVWRGIRLERAESLLLAQDLAVKEVAMLCGFQGSRRFVRAFRQVRGLPPQVWRAHVSGRQAGSPADQPGQSHGGGEGCRAGEATGRQAAPTARVGVER